MFFFKSHSVDAISKGEDYKLLNEYGFDIIKENKGRQIEYKLLNRSFELAELKLLVDSVQAAKFMNEDEECAEEIARVKTAMKK